MSYTTSKTNLIKDCSLLFDSEIFNYVDFLNSLSSSVLKSAYRKKALETHPDRSLALGKCKDKMDNRFKDVISAYERLDSFIQAEEKIILKNEVRRNKKSRTTKRRTQYKQENSSGFSNKKNTNKNNSSQKKQSDVSGRLYEGNIPRRKLLIGQFLYYSGLISWNTLFEAVYWQRKQRPIIGKIALDWGILTPEEIRRILTERNYKDNFGEYALRNGFITQFEFMAIIAKQKNLQPPIGKYFIQNGILGDQGLINMIQGLKSHNTKIINK
jgi:curved DNA-binding protein CbpA